jgi:hypothetical protein
MILYSKLLIKDILDVLNQIPNKKIKGRWKSTYELCTYLEKCIKLNTDINDNDVDDYYKELYVIEKCN